MVTRIVLLLITLYSFNTQAEEVKRRMNPFSKTDSKPIKGLANNEALYHFTFPYVDASVVNSSIIYSIDGENHTIQLDSLSFEVKTVAGDHVFQIYINSNYLEMYSSALSIKAGFMDNYNLYPIWSEGQDIQVEKPIIYLYPEEKTDISILLKVDGELTFTYPAYKNGWNVSADKNSNITVNNETFNYLFWESERKINVATIDFKSGFIVEQENVLSFLEDKLKLAGFTSKEKADFITYWAPRMIANETIFVQFIQNIDCNQFAELNISPQPDYINRFYVTWGKVNGDFQLITPQEITPINRNGFTVLEWGGQEISIPQLIN